MLSLKPFDIITYNKDKQQENRVMNKYTELEKDILDEIVEWYNHEGECFASDILERLGDSKRFRGALASLVKKGAIYVDSEEGGLLSLFDDDYRAKVNEYTA